MQRTTNRRLDDAIQPVVEGLEQRRLLSSALPFTLEFNSPLPGGLLDKDGEFIGFTHVQVNKNGTEYQPALIDLNTSAGVLNITSAQGSNRDASNTLVNSVEIEFDGTRGFAITARLRGPLSNIDAPFEQGGIMFGPDQDNYIKFVAAARSNGQFLQFNDEQTTAGVSTHTVDALIPAGSFASMTTLDLRLLGDPLSGKVTAEYSINGEAFVPIAASVTLTGAKKTEFFSAVANASLLTMHNNSVGPVTVAYDRFDVRHRPSISGIDPADGQTNVRRDAFVGADLSLPNGALDPSTVDTSKVKLYKTSSGALVPASVNTSGGGDSIVLQPTNILDSNTQYTFEVVNGVLDVSGVGLLPFKMTFTTGTDGGPPDGNIEFQRISLPTTSLNENYTSVTVGPDGKLYAGTVGGTIIRFAINADGTLGVGQEINSLRDAEGGARLMEGFVFDPASTPTNLIVWVTHGFFSFDDAPEWSSKVTRLSGPNLEVVQDAIIGLPRSAHNHLVNQPVFGPLEGGKRYLYFTQAGNTAQGGIDSTWGFRPERLLSAAMLRYDKTTFTPGSPLNVQTEERGAANYDPWAANAPLQIYATGLRNAYDIVWTHDGFLYAPNNGSNAGGATPATPSLPIFGSIRIDGDDDGNPSNGHYSNPAVPGINPLNETQPDYLYRVVSGGYYGHPNPARAEFVLNGGNPTAGNDPQEIKAYPVGTQPDRNYRGIAFNIGNKYSPNGIMEYRGSAFGGEIDGALMVVRFSGGDDVIILRRNPDGSILEQVAGIPGMTGFSDPLDLTQDPNSGFIYVAEYTGKRIVLLQPVSAPTTAPASATATATGPTHVVLSWDAVQTAATYRIQRRAPGEPGFSDYAVANSTSFVDTGASAMLTYQYRIRAENNGGSGPYGPDVSGTTTAPGQWSTGVELPESTAEAGGDIINGRLYVAGESTTETWEFNFSTGLWTARAVRPFTGTNSEAEHSTHAVNGLLYLIGGLSGGAENKVQIFNPATNTWTLGANRDWNAGSSPSAVINGQIYVAAGAVTTPSYAPVNRVARYNPATNTWTELAAMPSARHATMGATDGTRLWVFGGRNAGLEASDGTSTVQVYNPATNTWATSDDPNSGLAPIPRPVRGASVTHFNGEFYIFGGENSSGGHGATPDKVFNRVDIYNPQTNTWRTGRPMPTARHATVAIPHQGNIYIVGGGVVSGTSFSKGVEIFEVAANPVPSAPSNLVAITISPTRIDLGWTENSDNEASFQILRSGDGVNYSVLATVVPNTTAFSDLTVVDGNTYHYIVRAVNATGTSSPSNSASAVAGQPQPPAAPSNLVATPISTVRVSLSWSPSVSATLYLVERKGPNDSNFILVGTTTQMSFVDQGLIKNTTYEYRVRAENVAGFSGYSQIVSVTTPESVPMTSLDINTTLTGSTVELTPGRDFDVTGAGVNIWETADGFRYVYQELVGDFDVMVRVISASLTNTKAGVMARESLAADSRNLFAGLSSGDAFRLAKRSVPGGATANIFKGVLPVLPNAWVRLKRVGEQFSGYYSTDGVNWTLMGTTTFTTEMPSTLYVGMALASQSTTTVSTVGFREFGDVPGDAPAAPANVAATPLTHTQITLTWNASAGATTYRVQRRLVGGTFEDVALLSTTGFTDAGLSASTTYEYRVIAQNDIGPSLPSSIVSATTPAAPTAPQAPTGLSAVTFSFQQIDLSWNAASGATSYRIQRRDIGATFADIATNVTATTYKDQGLAAATGYEYQVIAVNAIGDSQPSAIDGAATDPAPTGVPGAPTGLSANAVSADRVDLSWTRSTGSASYRVQRRSSGGSFVDVAVNVTATTFTDLGLDGDTTYDYCVLGENQFGLSAPGNTASVTTPAAVHVGLDIGQPAQGGSTTPVGSGGTGYDLVAGGTDIFGTADQFHFAHRPVTGDFDIRVRIESLTQVNDWTKAGLMARELLTAGSRNAFVLASTQAKNTHRFTYRNAQGGPTSSTGGGAVSYPNVWLRLKRQGDTFVGFRSTDGHSWTQVGSIVIDMPDTIYFGMAATSHNGGATTTAQFRDLGNQPAPQSPQGLAANPASSDAAAITWTPSAGATLYRIERSGPNPGDPFVVVGTSATASFLDQGSGLVPGASYQYRVRAESALGSSPFSAPVPVTLPLDGTYVGADIGGPAFPGSSTAASGGFDITAGGTDIWSTSDQFRFVNTRVTGDFDMMLQINSSSLTGAKLGLMARSSLLGNSANVFAGLGVGEVYRLSNRGTPGASTNNNFTGGVPQLPNAWVRLRRVGNVFTGFYSSNGAVWTQMTSVTLALPPTVYFGPAVSAKSAITTVSSQVRSFGATPTSVPAAPTGLAATPVSQSQINLSWTASPGNNAYRIQRRLVGGTFADVATGVTGNGYSDMGLLSSTTYEYRVLAENAAGLSLPSNTASATTSPATNVPGAPTGLAATVLSHDRVSLSWNASSGAVSYRVQRRLVGGSFADVAVGVPTTTHIDTGLIAGTTYEYRVLAENGAGLSPPSNTAFATTPTAWVYAGLDLGAPALPGSTTRLDDQSYDITAGGLDIWGNSDQFHFAHRQITGDFDIRVQLTGVSFTQAKAGLMARASLDANSANAFAGIGADDAYRLSVRKVANTKTTNVFKGVLPVLPNVWLRLKRAGSVFTGFYSTDGVNWITMGNTTVTMPTTLYFGMAVASKSSSSTATAQFRNLGDFVP